MATIIDVAKKAGVSTATVSHVINHTRKVLPPTRAAVELAIQELNYRPNAVARGLQTSTTNTIGVLVADITSFFFAQIVRELEAAFEPLRYNLMVCNTDEQPGRESRYLEMLLDKRVDAIIAVPTGAPQPALTQLSAAGLPIVNIHRKPAADGGLCVVTDDVDTGYQATKHLLDLGHRRIAVLARAAHLSPVVERVEGYRLAMREYGLPIDESLIEIDHQTAEQASDAANRLLALRPCITGLIGMSLTSTLGMLTALQHHHIRYPEQISLVGVGDAPWMQVLPAPLTVVSAPLAEMCQAAAQLALSAIAEGKAKRRNNQPAGIEPAEKVFKATLLVRDSTRAIGPETREVATTTPNEDQIH